MTMHPPEITVFYDGACPLCDAEIGVYRRCAGAERVAFVDVSCAAAGPIVPGLDKASALERFHVRRADGTVVSGAAGFAHLWLALPGWVWIGRIVLLPGILQTAELTYRGFLLVRPALQWISRFVWREKGRAGPRS